MWLSGSGEYDHSHPSEILCDAMCLELGRGADSFRG